MSASIQRLFKNIAFNRYILTLDPLNISKTWIPILNFTNQLYSAQFILSNRDASMTRIHLQAKAKIMSIKKGPSKRWALSIRIVLIRSLFANRTECTQELEQVSRSYRTVFVQVSRTRIRKIEFTRPVIITCSSVIV